MEEKQKFQVPKLSLAVSAFDVVSGIFWFSLLFLIFPLPNNATSTVLKGGITIIWVAILFIYLGLLLRKSKKSLFVSSLKNNIIVVLLFVSLVVSSLLAIFPPDALWGQDFNMGNSTFLVITGILAFFLLKFMSVSAEKDLSKFFRVMPVWLVISDIVAVILYLIPETTYITVFGNYAEYLSFLRLSPFNLHGSAINTLMYHVLAINILGWQVSEVLTSKPAKGKNTNLIAYGLLLIVASIFAGAALPVAGDMLIMLFGAAVIFLLFWGFISFRDKSKKSQSYLGLMLIGFVVMILARLLFTQVHVTDTNIYLTLPVGTTLEIVQSSFMNRSTPIWRLLTGWGGSAFSYLYPLYRPASIVQQYGSDVSFFKSTNFWSDVLIEQGFFGIILWGALVINAVVSFFKSLKPEQLYFEFSLFTILAIFSIISFIPTLVLVVLFIVLAAYFDKVENQQENLKEIKVVSLHLTDYKSNVSNVIVTVFLAAAGIFLVFAVSLFVQGAMIHYYLLRTSQRINVAQYNLSRGDYTKAGSTLVDAYTIALNGTAYCQQCPTFTYLKLNTLYSLSVLNTNYPDKVGSLNIDKRFLSNRLINHSYALVDENPLRSDYWILSGNVFASLANSEKSPAYADEALLSYSAGLNLNPYNVQGRYDFVDYLAKLGDDAQSVQLMGQNVEILKQIAGGALKVQLLEAGYNVKLKQYDNAIKIYNQLKASLDQTSLSTADKESIVKFVNEQIEAVNKLKTDKGTKTETTPTASPTPTPTPTPSR